MTKKTLTLFIALILLASFAPHKKLRWMAMGDSITYHNGRPEATRDCMTKGYMDDVVEKLPYISHTRVNYLCIKTKCYRIINNTLI